MENIEQKIDRLITLIEEMNSKIGAISSPSSALPTSTPQPISTSSKNITLPELARRNSSQNGQQRVAMIVGYFEKIKVVDPISVSDIQQGWKEGKFMGTYAAVYLHRAIKEGYVREKIKGSYDLTQTGEDFFAPFITP